MLFRSNDTATTDIYTTRHTLSLHDALPIFAPVDSYAVGSYISGATPIDFTGDIKEIDGQPIAKRGRIPGLTESPRLETVDLSAYREG